MVGRHERTRCARWAAGLVGLVVAAAVASSGCAAGLTCARGDRRCAAVRGQLENARYNLEGLEAGARCAMPLASAPGNLKRMGPEIAPYLVEALSDPRGEVAAIAADVLIDLGHEADVRRWCAGADRDATTPQGLRCR